MGFSQYYKIALHEIALHEKNNESTLIINYTKTFIAAFFAEYFFEKLALYHKFQIMQYSL